MRLPTQNAGGIVPAEAYDPALKELFVSNPDANGVEVYSTVDGHWVGEIAVPGLAGLGFSPDHTKLLIGSITASIYYADPTTLHLTGQFEIPPRYSSTSTARQICPLPLI